MFLLPKPLHVIHNMCMCVCVYVCMYEFLVNPSSASWPMQETGSFTSPVAYSLGGRGDSASAPSSAGLSNRLLIGVFVCLFRLF